MRYLTTSVFLVYRFLLCILSVLWNGLSAVSHGAHLALRQFHMRPPDNFIRALRRTIKTHGLATLLLEPGKQVEDSAVALDVTRTMVELL